MTDAYLDRIAALKTVADCDIFARNAQNRGRADLVAACQARAASLRGITTVAPLEFEQRIDASLATLERLQGTRMSYTRRMIPRWGYIGMVERVVAKRRDTSTGFNIAIANGIPEVTFEAAVLAFPELFTEAAVRASQDRLTLAQNPKSGA